MSKIGWIVYGAIVCLLLAAIAHRAFVWFSYRNSESANSAGSGQRGELMARGKRPPGPDPREIFSDAGMRALAQAAVDGDTKGIRRALDGGARINGTGKEGLTPLHLSLLSFQSGSYRALLDAGADPNLPADNGDAVMPLAAMMPESDWLQAAIGQGGDLNRRDQRSRTPLMLAARHDREENARLLLAKGADVNAADRHGETALFHCFQAFRPNLAIVRALLAAGADPDRTNQAGFTARDFADTFGNPAYLSVFSPE